MKELILFTEYMYVAVIAIIAITLIIKQIAGGK